MSQRLMMGLMALLLTVALTGCGGATHTPGVEVSKGGDSGTITSNAGEQVTFTGQEGKLPDGFPLPLISGGTIGSATKITTNDKDGYSVEVTYTGAHKETGDFYEKSLKDLGVKVERTDVTSDGEVMIMLIGSSDKHDAWVMVSGKGEKGGTIAIMWGDK